MVRPWLPHARPPQVAELPIVGEASKELLLNLGRLLSSFMVVHQCLQIVIDLTGFMRPKACMTNISVMATRPTLSRLPYLQPSLTYEKLLNLARMIEEPNIQNHEKDGPG